MAKNNNTGSSLVDREKLIDAGKVWQVYDKTTPDNVLFEGSKSACEKWANNNFPVQYKYGTIRIGKLIYEK